MYVGMYVGSALLRTLRNARTALLSGSRGVKPRGEAHTGFEPVFTEEGDEGSLAGEQAAAPEPELPAELLRIVQRLTHASRKGARES
jgi:hypothetical protein